MKEKIKTELKYAALIGGIIFVGSGMLEACILKILECLGL